MSDTPLTDAVSAVSEQDLEELCAKFERKLNAIKALKIMLVHPFGCVEPTFEIGTVGGGELMLAGTRYVRAEELRKALK